MQTEDRTQLIRYMCCASHIYVTLGLNSGLYCLAVAEHLNSSITLASVAESL